MLEHNSYFGVMNDDSTMSDSKPDTMGRQGGTKEGHPLIDRFGRPVTNLRISLTQKCDHRCFFCHREGERDNGSELTVDEIETFVRQAVRVGVTSVKLTGGEPLLRNDIVEIVRRVASLVSDLSITTNGTGLTELARPLYENGLNRVNVSLHTLRRETHIALTGIDDIELVKRGIRRAIEVGFNPVKLNMTIMRGYNDDEIPHMIEYCGEIGAELQLIELQEIPGSNGLSHHELWVDMQAIERDLTAHAFKVEQRELHERKRYSIISNNGPVIVEVVRSMHNPGFCQHCTRLRITSKGQIKPCLLRDDNLVEARPYLSSERELAEAIERAVQLREPYWKEVDHS